jgi:TonB-linked SusC/RagA family outer membrane protein
VRFNLFCHRERMLHIFIKTKKHTLIVLSFTRVVCLFLTLSLPFFAFSQGVKPQKSPYHYTLFEFFREMEALHKVKFSINDQIIENKYVDKRLIKKDNLDHTLNVVLQANGLQYKKIKDYYIIQPLKNSPSAEGLPPSDIPKDQDIKTVHNSTNQVKQDVNIAKGNTKTGQEEKDNVNSVEKEEYEEVEKMPADFYLIEELKPIFLGNGWERGDLPEYGISLKMPEIKVLNQQSFSKDKERFHLAGNIIEGVTLSGAVTNNEGMAIAQANIEVKGTGLGTKTDKDGFFKILAPFDTVLLAFSANGFMNQELVAIKGDTLRIELINKPDFSENLIPIGYDKVKREEISSSQLGVDLLSLRSLPLSNIGDAMQGRVAGVQVVSSGEPGSEPMFRIRGAGSLKSTQPLIVIDGVPTYGGWQLLNPNDIETIELLKDGSATAIYGSQGANGVILVSTKRGKGAQNQFHFDAFTGVQNSVSFPQMLSAEQYARLNNAMMTNAGLSVNPDFANPSSLGEGTDWLRAMMGPAVMQNYSLSYGTHTDNSNFYISGNVFTQNGVVIGTHYNRYVIQMNADTQLRKGLRVGNSLTLNYHQHRSGDYSVLDAMLADPTLPIEDGQGGYAGPNGEEHYHSNIRNPIGRAKLIRNYRSGGTVLGSVYGEIQVLKNLTFRSSPGLRFDTHHIRRWEPAYRWQPVSEPLSSIGQTSQQSLLWNWDNILKYELNIGDDHDFSVLVGTSNQMENLDFSESWGEGGGIKNSKTLLAPENMEVSGFSNRGLLFSSFGRFRYSFRNKYFLATSLRRDGSSKFGENRFGYFPSVSAAWRLSEEGFLRGISYLNDVKLRAGYGQSGFQHGIAHYGIANAWRSELSMGGRRPLQENIMYPEHPIRWEHVVSSNLGLDVVIFKNRLYFSTDLYERHTQGLIIPRNTSQGIMYQRNGGSVVNKGVEMQLGTQHTIGAVLWTSDVNLAFNQNRVRTWNGSAYGSAILGLEENLHNNEEGYSLNSFYGYITNGLFQSLEEVNSYAFQRQGTGIGDIRFLDLNHDGIIDQRDRFLIGNPNPSYIFGLNNTFLYKGFDLSLFIQGEWGKQIFNANRMMTEAMGMSHNQSVTVLDRFTASNPDANLPKAIYGDPNGNTRPSDRFVENGSYIRLQNITLGYSLPEDLSGKIKLSTLRVYASVQNLFTMTAYSGPNPEVPFHGIDYNAYPRTQTYALGVNIGF